jgi:hypothetical protein
LLGVPVDLEGVKNIHGRRKVVAGENAEKKEPDAVAGEMVG